MSGRGARGAVVFLVVSGLVTGACSGPAGDRSVPSPPGDHVSTFTPVDSAASTLELTDDAREMTTRLRSWGDSGASVSVKGHAVVVTGGTALPAPASVLLAPGVFEVRPALCTSNPYIASTAGVAGATPPSQCSSIMYSVQAPTLIVNVTTGISNSPAIPPDPVLASYPSSSATYNDSHPAHTVLVPEVGGGGVRYLLGPAELDGTVVAGARATYESPQWRVDVTFTGAGASAWDALSRKYFHEFIGLDLDGQAVSVPLVQPSNSAFVSFGGRTIISGNFTRQTAEDLAAVLNSGPLATPLSP